MSAPVLSLQTLTVDPATGNVYPVAAGGNTLNLPAGSRVGGVAIGTGTGLPSMTGNTGKLLTTDGSAASWASPTALSLQTTTGTLALGGFGSITGRIGSANLPLGIIVVKHTNGSEVAYTTVASAVTAAVSGETAIIGPGTYNESVRLKNGVNIHFQNGAQLINSTGGPAFYTDGTSGAVTCKITGQGVIHSSAVDSDSNAIQLNKNGDSVYVEAREIYGYHSAVWATPDSGTNSITIKADTVYSEIYDTLLGDNGSTIHATVRNIYTNGADEDSVMEMNGTSFGTLVADRAYHKTGGIMTLAGTAATTINVRIRSFEGTLAAGGNMDFEGTITSPSTLPPVLCFLASGKTLRLRGKIVAGGATVAMEIQTVNAGTIILDHSYFIPNSGSNTFLASNAQTVTSYGTTTTRPIGSNVTISGDLSISGAIPASYLGSGGAQAYDADLTSWAAITRASGFDTFATTPTIANFKSLLTDETTVGWNLFSLANPTAVTFLRINADNTVTARNAANFKLDLSISADDVSDLAQIALTGSATDITTGILNPFFGGTGIANDEAATLTRSGNHALTITTTGITGITLPTSGTLLASGGALGSPSSAGTIPAFTLGGTISGGGNQLNNVIIGTMTPLAGTFTTGVFGSTTSLLLGTAGSAVGNIGFRNATSGTATLAPPTGALGTYTVTLPNAASTIPIASQQITWAGPTAARTYTLPDAAVTLASLTGTETLSNKTLTTPKIAKIVAPSDSTTAIQITAADGSTAAGTWDTTNLRLGLGVTPSYVIDILAPSSAALRVRSTVGSAGLKFDSAGTAFFDFATNGTNKWRLALAALSGAQDFIIQNQVSGRIPIYISENDGVSIGSSTDAGTNNLLIAGGIVGTTAAGNAAAGNVGEQISASVVQGSATALTTATPKTVTSISLTAGDWDVTAVGCSTGASTGTVFDVAISANNNSFTGTVLGDSRCQTPTVSLTGADASLMIPQFRVNISATTTYYLVVSETFTIGSPAAYGRISARRRR